MDTKDNTQTNEGGKTAGKKALAILAAFGACLIGCLLFGLVYNSGYIVYIMPLLIVLITAESYAMINKKMDATGWVVAIILCVVGIILTILVSCIIQVKIALQQEGYDYSFSQATSVFFQLLESDANIQSMVIRDVAINMFALAVGGAAFAISTSIRAKRQAKAQTQISNAENQQKESSVSLTDTPKEENLAVEKPVEPEQTKKVAEPKTKEEIKETPKEEPKPEKKTKKCPSCGAELVLTDDLYVCAGCGKKFRVVKK